jgi:NADH-quinone oxidoreductase subunit N
VFTAAIDADQAWLAAVAVVNTVISLYYYLRVIAPTVLEPPAAQERVPSVSPTLTIALVVTAIATVAIGVGAEPLLCLAESSTIV